MASSASQTALRRTCIHLTSSSRTPKRSLSSQCLRIASSTHQHTLRRRQQRQRQQPGRRHESTEAPAAPADPKIAGIVEQISQLTLLETADLVQSLKIRLNIPDISFAPPPTAGGAAPAAAAAAEPEEEAPPAAAEKTLFTIKLESFEAAAKPKIIKEVKSMLGLSLVDSKKFVESAPKMLKEGVAKDEAQKIKSTLEGLGAKITMD